MKKHTLIFSILFVFGCSATSKTGTVAPEVYPSPEAAVQDLVATVKSKDRDHAKKIAGSEGEYLFRTDDEVVDQKRRDYFLKLYNEKNSIQDKGESKVLVIGNKNWPFPIPMVRSGSGWKFDAAAGKEEILNRRIGMNELQTIGIMEAYVMAQLQYYDMDPNGDGKQSFAKRIISTPGSKDGLYWEDKDKLSPFGPLIADAEDDGYNISAAKGKPFRGYYYRILTAQGENAKDGPFDYFSADGEMTEGFALLAYPAVWGETGLMTFEVNYDGIVYQKNLGPETEKLASMINEYNPDGTWTKAESQ